MKVLGITGSIVSGKGFVIDLIKKKFDCYHVYLGSVIQDTIKKKKGIVNRESMQNVGNDLRKQYGGHILAKLSTEFMPREKPIMIVDGIRNPEEAGWLRKTYKENFILLAIDAPQEIRFQRSQKRAGHKDAKTIEEFIEMDERDQGKGEPGHGQNVSKCIEMANLKIINDNDEIKMKAQMNELFQILSQ